MWYLAYCSGSLIIQQINITFKCEPQKQKVHGNTICSVLPRLVPDQDYQLDFLAFSSKWAKLQKEKYQDI